MENFGLPLDVLGIVASFHPAAAERLWIYLDSPARKCVTPGRDWADHFKEVESYIGENNNTYDHETTRLFGRLHSFNNIPAIDNTYGLEYWWNGIRHHDTEPAFLRTDMRLEWESPTRMRFLVDPNMGGYIVSVWLHYGQPASNDAGQAIIWTIWGTDITESLPYTPEMRFIPADDGFIIEFFPAGKLKVRHRGL